MKPFLGRIKKHSLVMLSGAVVLMFGTGLWLRSRPAADRLSEPVRRGRVVEAVYGIGTVTANKSFALKPAVPSTVRELFVKEGERVKRGQKLAALEDAALFHAPFAGTVTSLPVKEGETVFAQSVLLELVDLLDRYVVVSLEQRAAIRARRGQKTTLSFENLREKPYEGTVESVYSNAGNFLVRIDAPDLPPQILPGMTADVSIAFGERDGVLLVPAAAVEGGEVRVQRGRGRPMTAPVKIGAVDGAVAELLSGDVREGDRLVLRGKKKP